MIAREGEEEISASKSPVQIRMWEGLLQGPQEVPLNALFFRSGLLTRWGNKEYCEVTPLLS